jgi:hypothetical protein
MIASSQSLLLTTPRPLSWRHRLQTFSDIFEEGGFESVPFHQGFGMMTIHKVPKPVYR